MQPELLRLFLFAQKTVAFFLPGNIIDWSRSYIKLYKKRRRLLCKDSKTTKLQEKQIKLAFYLLKY